MRFSELETAGLEGLECDEKRGLILEDGRRILSFRVATFEALVDRLQVIAGSKVPTTILLVLGEGYVLSRYSCLLVWLHQLRPTGVGDR